MRNKIISKGELAPWVNELAKKGNLIGVREKGFGPPAGEAGKYEFAPIESAEELRLDYDVAVTSPKKFFQPSKETLLTFKRGGDFKLNAVVEAESLVIFGIHPYDAKALSQMDKVFADDNRDSNYWEKRGKAVIVGIDPACASKWSFWDAMGAATVDKGFDLWLTDLGDRYFIEVGTGKGEKLLKHATTSEATEADVSARNDARSKLATLCAGDRKIKAELKDLPDIFEAAYDNEIWEKRAEKCYSCGSCNLVCPTCYCFDVREEIDLDLVNGRRVRLWDGCLLESFAAVGHGENFRGERSERFRHRLMRKFVYMPKKLSERGSGFASPSERGSGGRSEAAERVVPPDTINIACVGCGRCSSVCLPDITDPVKVINELK